MSFSSAINLSLKQIETHLGSNVVYWKNIGYACSPSGYGSGGTLGEGGISLISDLIVNIRTDLFVDAVYPEKFQLLVYKNKEYRIENVRMNASQTFLQITCIDPDKDL